MALDSVKAGWSARGSLFDRVGLLRAGSWALADQALVSVSNFAVMLVLARGMTVAEFGAFTLAYTALQIGNSFQAALVTQPHNVLGATRPPADYPGYTTSTLIGQFAFALVTAAVILLAAIALRSTRPDVASLLVVLAVTAAAWQVQEFGRRVLYTEGRVGAAFANDLVSYGGQTVAIVALWRADRVSSFAGLAAIAATSALASVLLAWQLRTSLAPAFSAAVLRENWEFGKWLAAATAMYWLSTYLYVYLAAALLGTAASGALKAALVLLGPLNIMLSSLDGILPVRLARTYEARGEAAVWGQMRGIYALTAPVVGGYCLGVALLSGPLLRLAYGERYAGYRAVVVLLAGYIFVSYAVRVFSSALRALRRTRAIFQGFAAACVIALAIGWPIVAWGGVNGAVCGMLISVLANGAVLVRAGRDLPPEHSGIS